MFEPLNADGFNYRAETREEALEFLLSKIVECYRILISDTNVKNNENKIRDKLFFDYLTDNKIREQVRLKLFNFEEEAREKTSVGRTDIKVTSYNTFEVQEDYYIIECKRLDNKKTGLNAKYIKQGLHRFTSKYYSAFEGINAMIGFVVEDMDIHKNIDNLNDILLEYHLHIDTISKITQADFIDNFEFHYISTHLDNNVEGLKIYHLMLDFSNNIES